jgi:hypothetical protein
MELSFGLSGCNVFVCGCQSGYSVCQLVKIVLTLIINHTISLTL